MSVTKNKASTAAKTLREAQESPEFPNSQRRSFRAAADALEAFAGESAPQAGDDE